VQNGSKGEQQRGIWQHIWYMENCPILGVVAGSEHLKTAELNPVVCVAHKCNVAVLEYVKLWDGLLTFKSGDPRRIIISSMSLKRVRNVGSL